MEEFKVEYNNYINTEHVSIKSILIVIAGNIGVGGVQVFLRNMISHMDTSKLFIHLYAPGIIISKSMLRKFLDLGIVVYIGKWNKEDNFREVVKHDIDLLMKKNKYDIVHCNTGKVWLNYYCCLLGVGNGIPVRIVHSHNALIPRYNPEVQKQDDYYRKFILENATNFLACSEKAAVWLFGTQFKGYSVLKNGIDLEKYRFNKETRIKYRTNLGINEKFVIGHIGKFSKVKNHLFLLDIFKEVTRYYDNTILLMIGEGELMEEVRNKAGYLNIKDKCIFLGERHDIPGVLQAMDIFVFPSLFEGSPISVIEAQATGLPCIISKEITEEVCLTKEVLRVPLEMPVTFWAEQILKYQSKNISRAHCEAELEEEGYNIVDSAKLLFDLYVN